MTNKQQPPIPHAGSTVPQGPQGVDKAPGEDPAGKPEGDPKGSLTGKKVDGDPADPKDQPLKP